MNDNHLMILYFTGVLKSIEEGKLKGQNVIADILAIADVVEETMGGTSGALYSYVPSCSCARSQEFRSPYVNDTKID